MSGKLKEVRERITSVKSTQQITKAMKMVSAAKLRRAQQAITEMRPYSDRLDHMLSNILSALDGDASTTFGEHREVKKVAVAVVTSSKGLCGAFNSNIIKAAVKKIEEDYSEQRKAGNLSILCVGKKGFEYFKKNYSDCTIIGDHVHLVSKLTYNNVAEVVDGLMQGFEAGDYDCIDVAYGRFKNAALQFPEMVQFLPVAKLDKKVDSASPKSRPDYLFEPSKEQLLEHLIPSILKTTFQKFVLDTHASEHGARMTAMDSATENAEEMLKDLKINYNKARQEAITKELSEIVGGAAALGG